MRYSETQAGNPTDFSPRDRFTVILQFVTIFFVAYAVLIAHSSFIEGQGVFNIWSAIFILVIAAAITYIMNYNRDIVLATEFQNALFASAINRNYLFSIIARKDGSLMFVDRDMDDKMPAFSRIKHSYIQDIMEVGEVSKEHQAAILNSLRAKESERLLFSMKMGEEKMDLVLTIDPLAKAGNFSLLRAREYYDKRQGIDHSPTAATSNDTATQTVADIVREVVTQPAVQHSNVDQFFNTLPIGVCYADANGELQFTNTQFEAWLGYPAGYLTNAPHRLQALFDNPDRVFTHEDYHGQAKIKNYAGKLVTCHVSVSTELQNGTVQRLNVIIYPNTATAEQGQSRSKPLPEAQAKPASQTAAVPRADHGGDLFEDAPIAIVRCNLEGQIIHVNNAFDKLIKLQDAPRPKHILDLIADDKKESVSSALGQLLESGNEMSHVDVEFILPNAGDTISVSIFANQRTQNDLVTFYLVDVSEQKNLELRFAHSQKMQAVGQLAGGIAHDFNNLLTAMIGFCDLLLMRHPAGDQSFADIMQIKQNANRAANLVRQLLAFSRRQTLQAKNLDITEVMAELSNLIRRLIGENIELKMLHGRDLNMVKADQGQLEQVIINLAVNARDAMTDGGLLTIRSSNVTVDDSNQIPKQMLAPVGEDGNIPYGNYVLIEVSDTGTGIPKDVMPKIFEPFFSTKEIGSGTGLGLATVYGIIKQTGGYIFVNSVAEKGTQFHIYFPALSAQEERKYEAEVTEQHAQDLTGRETIVLVEDETPVRAFAVRALRNKGYTVFEADSGEAGLETIHKYGNDVDLIVTDVIMPGMNGPTMVDKISESYPNIKVIFMSGYAEDIFMNNYGAERSFNYLAKPFTLKQLAAKVKEVLSS